MTHNRCLLTDNRSMFGYVHLFESSNIRLTRQQQFGLHVHEAQGALSVDARILKPPTLQYGRGSKQQNVVRRLIRDGAVRDLTPHQIPRDGKWNMVDKKFFKPGTIERWVVVVYERVQRFGQNHARDMISGLLQACNAVGTWSSYHL